MGVLCLVLSEVGGSWLWVGVCVEVCVKKGFIFQLEVLSSGIDVLVEAGVIQCSEY
jgi:hypothetical protein